MSAKEKIRKRLFLIDGPAIYYRAYFAFIRNPLINSRGENTSATFGFTNSTLKILRDEKPDYIAVIFDTKEPTFRHKLYSRYKANREAMPEDLVEQLPRIDSVIDALNIPSYKLVGYEADDIMGSFAKKAEALGIDVFLVTGDKDMCQLVSDHVKIYNPGRGGTNPETMDKEGVIAKWGVRPNQIIDFLALTGDSSDNIPGVAGVGPKTAASLLSQFDTLDEVLKRTSEIKAAGVRSKIEAGKENALMSHELVTLCLDVPLKFDLKELEARGADYEKTRTLFRELEFNSALKGLFPQGADDDDPTQEERSQEFMPRASVDYRLVKSLSELREVVEELNKLNEVAIDTETTSLNPVEAQLVGISLCARAGVAYYIPVGHKSEESKNLPVKKALNELKSLFMNENIQKTGQNIKYDLHVLRNAGAEIRNVGFDTMLAAYALNPSIRKYSLDFLAQDQFDYTMKPISDLIGKGKDQISFAEVNVDDAVFYACEDADYTYRLRGTLESDLERTGLDSLYKEIENPLIPVLMDMESTGVKIDTDFLSVMSDELEKNLDSLRRDIYKSANGEFNINSPKQLAKILFDDLKLPAGRKTSKTGGYSTDANTLEDLAGLHSLPKLLLDYRQLNKLKSTYVDALPTMVNARTGRVHTTFNQTIAATGRLSSTDPNLQNIPIRTEIGREIRRAFVPKDQNYRILTADYSQIELRILASVSGDKNLIKAFKKGEDIHNRTAAEVYGVELDEVTDEQRRLAKTANFAVIYGVSAYGLSQQSDLDVSAAKEFIDTYFKRYPGIQSYMDETLQFAQDKGYVETLSGRRRYIPEINAKNRQIRQFAERTAINSRIQGAAADMIKLAMIAISKSMSGMKSKMILQVHDELVFDAHVDEIDKLTNLARNEMVSALELKVPIIVDIGCGRNWLEAKS